MVLYFSATGNTEYVAKQIAEGIGNESVNLLDRIKMNDCSPIHSDRPFVICAPVHVCEMPRFFAAYLTRLPLTGSKEVYFITTSGGYAGISGNLAKRIFKKKGLIFMGHTDIKMPPNYPVSKRYKLLSPTQSVKRLKASEAEILKVAACIGQGEKIKDRYVFLFEKIIVLPFNPIWTRFKHTTRHFSVTDDCVGCSKCAKLCPLNKISMVDGKPEWEGICSHCMACIANCPCEAIEYAHVKKGVEKYNIGKYINQSCILSRNSSSNSRE